MSSRTASQRTKGTSRPTPTRACARIAKKERFREIAGCLSDADAKELRGIISGSCEKVNRDEW